jgi:hypothetical protein
MSDPRDCHGGECADCGGWFRDEEDLNDAMLCEICERDAASLPRRDWFAVAAAITGATR